MKNIKAKAIYFTIIAFIALIVIVYFSVKYVIDERLLDKPKDVEEKVDNSIITGTFMDDFTVTDTSKTITQSTITFNDNKKFVLTVDVCSKTLELNGTYEIKNNTDINLTFNTNNEYITETAHKSDKLIMDASGILTYVGDSWGCSPLKDTKYILKIEPEE
jgi:hypothetical protein